MALIKCPECGKEVSDKASVCVNCGFPINNIIHNTTELSYSELLSEIKVKFSKFLQMSQIHEKNFEIFYYENKVLFENLKETVSSKNDVSIYDSLTSELLDMIIKASKWTNWSSIKKVFEIIDFSKISSVQMDKVTDEMYKQITGIESWGGNTNHILYSYILYQILKYGSQENESKLMQNLSTISAGTDSLRYDDVMELCTEKMGLQFLEKPLSITATSIKSSKHLAQHYTPLDSVSHSRPIKPIVKCPYCQSGNTKKISSTAKAVNIAIFGIFGNKRKYQWHCNNCNSDF